MSLAENIIKVFIDHRTDGSDLRTLNPNQTSQFNFVPTMITTVDNRTFVLSSEDNTLYQFVGEISPDIVLEESSISFSLNLLSGLTSLTTQDFKAYEDGKLD